MSMGSTGGPDTFSQIVICLFALRSYCEYVLHICITRYLENEQTHHVVDNVVVDDDDDKGE